MTFFQAFKIAIKSIFSNKVRSFLTMLGVIIGVSSVISAVAFAQGSTKSITDSIQGLGTNMIQLSITGRGSNKSLKNTDLQEFIDKNSELISGYSPVVSGSVTVKAGNNNKSISLYGISPDYEYIRNKHVQSGRFLLSFDSDYMMKVAVIGTAVANTLYPGENPIGKELKVNGQVFTVIGLLQETAYSQDNSDDDQIFLPYNVAQRVVQSTNISSYLIQAATPEKVDSAMEKLNTFLGEIYSDTSSYRVFNQSQMLSTLNTITNTLMIVLGGIAAISLIVGGIGIMNIMLVSVTERTKEIGIRKAIGAKKKHIMIQFLIEAIFVTGIGGIIGILIGLGVIKWVVSNFTTPVFSLTWILISFGISLTIGVIFGLFPAYKAARLNPIEALRFE